MIKISRAEKPAVLLKYENAWLSDYLSARQEFDRLTADLSAHGQGLSSEELITLQRRVAKAKANKRKSEAKYGHQEIRDALKIMFNSSKCAFCESHISHIGYPNIEHFRPKGSFPKLCFDWDNLLVACSVCNDAGHKGDRFPNESEGGPLVNPVDEDPDLFFVFGFNPETLTADVIPINERGECTETTLGLNRYDLVKVRSEMVHYICLACEQAKKGNLEALALMERACLLTGQYSAFAKAIAKQAGLW